ncbi:MAG: segregation/condensation protein A [Clostridia bacterium]|nr:segregation/condensation protein A [Clostridia bacterium]
MDAISYKLPNFEGPLDLLLQLVQKNKLNIYDIPIAELLQQYMDTIHMMQAVDMEIASEFLDMAARLVYIKSTMLLPKHEETEQLKQQLSEELISYQLCKECARLLAARNIGADLFIREAEEIEPDQTYRRVHPKEVLLDALLAAAGRKRRQLPPPEQSIRNIVTRKIVSVSSRITVVLRNLYRRKRIRYQSLFEHAESKSELVATFLALLELIKVKRVCVSGSGAEMEVAMTGDYQEGEEYEMEVTSIDGEETV